MGKTTEEVISKKFALIFVNIKLLFVKNHTN